MNYIIKDGFDNMDFVKVTAMLATTYWSPGIEIDEVVQAAIYSTLVVGAFDEQNQQIGFARLVSDRTRFAYILDVVIDEACRQQGIGQALINYMLSHPNLKDVYQWLLITRDAHEFYKKLGFQVTERAPNYMEIRTPWENRRKI
ncbi:MAG: GNAT family N-acetyltransferase [Anaerolineales bacterium]|nr:GNAT family N-acetyltransferase [Anaerolineales bacterium]